MDVITNNDAHWLLPLYISSFAKVYDPHSEYMSANNTEDFDISMSLSLVGIGALLTIEDGAAKIVRLIPGGPAEKDGRLNPGDKIIAVAQGDEEPVDILHWPLSKSVRLIRGEKKHYRRFKPLFPPLISQAAQPKKSTSYETKSSWKNRPQRVILKL